MQTFMIDQTARRNQEATAMMQMIVWTRCFVLGHKWSKPRKVRHHARQRQRCSRCDQELITALPTNEKDAEQRTLPLDGSTYQKREQPSAEELADHLDPPWIGDRE